MIPVSYTHLETRARSRRQTEGSENGRRNGHRGRRHAQGRALSLIHILPDPVGRVLDHRVLASGVDLTRVSVPLGLVAMVYEARPNVTADAAGGEKCALDEVKDLYGFETAAIVTMEDVVECLYNKECDGKVVIDDERCV